MTADLKRRAVLGVGWSFLDRTATKLIAFVVFLALAGLLTPRDFGLVAMSKAILALVRPLVGYGTGPALVQRESVETKLTNTAFWLNVSSGALAALGVTLLSRPVSGLLGEPALAPVLVIISLQLFLEGLGITQSSLLQRGLSFKLLTLKALIAETAGGLVGLGLALNGYGLWSLVGQTLARQLVGTIMLWVVANWRPRIEFSVDSAKELLGYGYSVVGASLINSARRHIDQFLIGALLGTGPLGIYVIALRFINELGNLIMGSVGVVVFPMFARLQANREKLVPAFLKAVELTAFLAFPAFIGLGAIADELIPSLIGPQWTSSVPVIRALIPLGLFGALTTFNGSIIMALGKPNWNMALGLLDLGVGILAILASIPFGLVPAAFSYAMSGVVRYSAGLWLVGRLLRFRVPEYFSNLVPPLIGAVVMVGVLEAISSYLLTEAPVLVRLGILIAAGISTYIGLFKLLRPLLLKEVVELGLLVVPIRKSIDR